MPSRPSLRQRIRIAAHRAFQAADAYFLSDAVRARSANELAYARIGVIACIAMGLSAIAFIPWQTFHWPTPVLVCMLVSGLLCSALPFALRRRDGIRHLGHLACAQVTAYALAVVVLSGGRATGILPVLPMIPMLALLMRGGRAVLGWGAATVGVIAIGALLAGHDVAPRVAGFRELQHAERYPIALLCLLTMLGVTLLFEKLWNRSALELARRARADLALREDRYRTLLEHASEGLLVVDAAGRIRFASPAAERLIGLEPGRYVGRGLTRLTDAAGIAETMPLWERALAHPGERVRAVLRRTLPRSSDGGPPPRFEITMTNQLDHPAVGGVVIHLHDVTALFRAETNYRNLVEQSLQGIAVVREFGIVYANEALAELFGTRIERIVGRHVNELLETVHPDDRDRVVDALNAPSSGPAEPLEMRIRRERDGATRWIQIRWADAVSEGMTARQIAYVDITAQKELDAARLLEQERLEARIAERTRELEASQQTLRAQERLAAVGTLAAGVAHQINNPVGAILAAAEFALVTEADPDHAAVTHKALHEIRAQATRCGRIIRSILQFSRARSAEKWSGKPIDVLRASIDATRQLARDRGASVSLEFEPEVATIGVWMSPIELEQVFINLILNAIQAQSCGARVAITARRLGHEIEIRIEDDGPGIRPEDRGRVFDPFFTTRLKGGGTGLGLSVAHGIVEDHGGHMELVATTAGDDRGACFRVTLPIDSRSK
ncbi:MAG: PAS domain S-box protein [Myxococcota bacterium]